MLGFQDFRSASKTLKGIEAMSMIKKGQFGIVLEYWYISLDSLSFIRYPYIYMLILNFLHQNRILYVMKEGGL